MSTEDDFVDYDDAEEEQQQTKTKEKSTKK
jgi:hypothetical protein